MFGVNAELLIDHAWGSEPCTLADIKAYRPQAHSISSANMTKREVSFFMPVPPAYPIYFHYTVPPPF